MPKFLGIIAHAAVRAGTGPTMCAKFPNSCGTCETVYSVRSQVVTVPDNLKNRHTDPVVMQPWIGSEGCHALG